MKTSITKAAIGLLLFSTGSAFSNENPKSQIVFFQENKGQICDQNYKPRPDVLFSGMANGLNYHLTKTGISYQLSKVENWREVTEQKSKTTLKAPEKTSIYRVDVKWLGINENAQIENGNALEGVSNYYLPQCPDGVLNVKNYSNLKYKNIYNGIDLKWYEKDGNLEYDYIVSPNTDVSQIKMQINGAEKLSINKKGELEITTPLGVITEKAPIAYQASKRISSVWVIENNIAHFKLGEYDRNQLLIIDPAIVRSWGTYYGGAGDEHIRDVTIDASNNSYVVGYSGSTATGTVIATTGAYQTTHSGGTFDAFTVKFNPSGVRQWSTYYGGSGDDFGLSNALDGATTPNLYIIGYSNTTGTVLATAGAHQVTNSGNFDAYLVKFNSSTGARIWSTYYGNTGVDYGFDCTTDAANNVIAVGTTSTAASSTLIATTGSHQNTHAGVRDGFIVKFNSGGVRQWGTYYGGTGIEDLFGCAIDMSTNDILIVGQSDSFSAIATAGALQTSNGGGLDGILIKFNTSGIRQWGTYYGGTNTDQFRSCAVNSTGDLYVAGIFNTAGFSTSGSHQSVFGGGSSDAFLGKFLVSNGFRTWATYYGGSGADEGYGCSLDNSGNVYLSGNTISTANISTPASHQITFGGGAIDDAFIAEFNPLGVRLFGSYYGAGVEDLGWSCEPDALGNVYLVGSTKTTTAGVISTSGSHQSTYGGGAYDGYIAKFLVCQNLTLTVTGSSTLCSGSTATLTAGGTGFTTYTWSTGPLTSSIAVSPTITTTYTLTAGTATAGCTYSDTHLLTVYATPTINISASPASGSVCPGETATLTASGATTGYTWTPAVTFSTMPTIFVIPLTTTTYSVIGMNGLGGCTNTNTVTVTVNPKPSLTLTASSSVTCVNNSVTLTGSPVGGVYSGPNVTGSTFNSPTAGTFTTTYTYTNSTTTCTNSTTRTITVSLCTGLSELTTESSQLLIYPNPNNGNFTIIGPDPGTYTIINSIGQFVKEIKVEKETEISISNLAEGVYYLVGNGVRAKLVVSY